MAKQQQQQPQEQQQPQQPQRKKLKICFSPQQQQQQRTTTTTTTTGKKDIVHCKKAENKNTNKNNKNKNEKNNKNKNNYKASGDVNMIGPAGATSLRNALSQTPNPWQFVREFQAQNGIDQSNAGICTSGLALLDLHNISRSQFSAELVRTLRDKLIERMDSLSVGNLELLLEKTFSFIRFEHLQQIPLAILERHPVIPAAFLQEIASNQDIYNLCSIVTRRQIWQTERKLLKRETSPLFAQYRQEMERCPEFLFIQGIRVVTHPAKRRENSNALKQLVDIIGHDIKSYRLIVHCIRDTYVKTGDRSLCSLRSDILMTFHDRGISEIYEHDRVHEFAWCMDACVRDNTVEARRIREMQQLFSTLSSGAKKTMSVKSPEQKLFSDVGMILASPFVDHTIIRAVYALLVGVIRREAIPKEDDTLRFLTQVADLGCNSRAILTNISSCSPTCLSLLSFPRGSPDPAILQTFYPAIASAILDDEIRDERNAPDNLDSKLRSIILEKHLCLKVFLYYGIRRTEEHDEMRVIQVVTEIALANVALESDDEAIFFFFPSLKQALCSSEDCHLGLAVIRIFAKHLSICNCDKTHLFFVQYLVDTRKRIPMNDLISLIELLCSSFVERRTQLPENIRAEYKKLVEFCGSRLPLSSIPSLCTCAGEDFVKSRTTAQSEKELSVPKDDFKPITSYQRPGRAAKTREEWLAMMSDNAEETTATKSPLRPSSVSPVSLSSVSPRPLSVSPGTPNCPIKSPTYNPEVLSSGEEFDDFGYGFSEGIEDLGNDDQEDGEIAE